VKNRAALIREELKNELEMYITGIVQNHRHKLIAIGTMPDHIHIFIGYNVNQLIPELVEEIKTSSNAFINKKISGSKFEWQKGYGAFTCSHLQMDIVSKYVLSQQDHHARKSFQKEYLALLEENDVVFKNEYVFEFFE
jgi:REP element-mobilizing transposase RayT